ncbi:RimK family alpha-L-glutamate ligase [Methanomassiliicoccales archaeon LGM-RCC1]|nr:RimK family alpha-L-glutamate ligase [Candidatus Methanomethylophilaceae archaeon]WII07188.1 RimK family alpha-L-glutamate ligase [Methanomassiliicoccales archaeon LGM-RCC1]
MRGAVVINGHLCNDSFREPADMIVQAGSRAGIPIEVFHNTDLTVPIGDEEAFHEKLGDCDFVVFWDKDVKLAKNLEVCGYPVFNCSECIRVCDDKSLTHLTLADYGIPSIRTLASPMTFGQPLGDWVKTAQDILGYPMVVKDCFGSFGEQVRLIVDETDLMNESSDPVPKIFQEYIECDAEDIRIEVVGEKVVASVKRKAAEGDFRANASNGGTMTKYVPTEEEAILAIDAAAAVQADFAGVDIINSPEGPVVCEVNSNAHITNLKNATGIDVSDHIIRHIVNLIQ